MLRGPTVLLLMNCYLGNTFCLNQPQHETSIYREKYRDGNSRCERSCLSQRLTPCLCIRPHDGWRGPEELWEGDNGGSITSQATRISGKGDAISTLLCVLLGYSIDWWSARADCIEMAKSDRFEHGEPAQSLQRSSAGSRGASCDGALPYTLSLSLPQRQGQWLWKPYPLSHCCFHKRQGLCTCTVFTKR